jgi:nicotinamide-nucleotide amidase
MNAEILAVGSELLTPFRLDTNSLFLTDQLNQLGVRVTRKSIIGDNLADLRDAFKEALSRSELILACGGLGPTEDDLTRIAVAEVLERPLILDNAILQSIQERFNRFKRPMPEINSRQAMVPEGAEPLRNSRGTAPGLFLKSASRFIFLLPGPPSELKPMFEEEVKPRLLRLGLPLRLHTRDLRVTGLPESDVDQRVASIYAKYPGTETTILAAPREIQLHPRIWSSNPKEAEKILDDMVESFSLVLGENLYSTSGETLESVLARILNKHHATIAVAESCTGGLLAARLTNVPGSSSFFLGGVVCYSNDLKTAWTGVPENIIATKGAVSAEVAILLAQGIRKETGATLGVGVTGIAGPGGGTPEKPVGLVHIAVADDRTHKEHAFNFPGDRDLVRAQATLAALDMARRYFTSPTRP